MDISRFTIVIYFVLAIISLTLSYTLNKPHQYFSSLFFGVLGNVMEFMVVVTALKCLNYKKIM
jgi:hypothetical protein